MADPLSIASLCMVLVNISKFTSKVSKVLYHTATKSNRFADEIDNLSQRFGADSGAVATAAETIEFLRGANFDSHAMRSFREKRVLQYIAKMSDKLGQRCHDVVRDLKTMQGYPRLYCNFSWVLFKKPKVEALHTPIEGLKSLILVVIGTIQLDYFASRPIPQDPEFVRFLKDKIDCLEKQVDRYKKELSRPRIRDLENRTSTHAAANMRRSAMLPIEVLAALAEVYHQVKDNIPPALDPSASPAETTQSSSTGTASESLHTPTTNETPASSLATPIPGDDDEAEEDSRISLESEEELDRDLANDAHLSYAMVPCNSIELDRERTAGLAGGKIHRVFAGRDAWRRVDAPRNDSVAINLMSRSKAANLALEISELLPSDPRFVQDSETGLHDVIGRIDAVEWYPNSAIVLNSRCMMLSFLVCENIEPDIILGRDYLDRRSLQS